MKKGWILAISFVFSISINSANADDEILLRSRQFIPERGITAAAKAKIEAIPEKAHVLMQLERIPSIEEMIAWLDEVYKSGQLDIPEDEYLAFRKVLEEMLQ